MLEAVVQTYIETAEPAGSQTIARRFGLGVSPATIRQHDERAGGQGLSLPPAHLGRPDPDRPGVPGLRGRDHAARRRRAARRGTRCRPELLGSRNAVEEILRRAAQVLGVLTQELGVAVAPALDEMVLERLELVPVSSERLLLVFNLRSGVVRTIFVEVPGPGAAGDGAGGGPDAQRAAGRAHAPADPRHAARAAARRRRRATAAGSCSTSSSPRATSIFDLSDERNAVVLGSAQMLAEQPEFASNARMRELLRLTEGRDLLKQALASRRQTGPLDHHRRREPRCPADRLHPGHRVLRGRRRSRA